MTKNSAPRKRIGIKKLRCTALVSRTMETYYKELLVATQSGNSKVAWCSSMGPVELLRSLGFKVYFPENHAAIIGVTRLARGHIQTANAAGFSSDICSYLTCDIGAYLSGETPLTRSYSGFDRVPRPDVLVYNTNQCRCVKDWFSWYAEKLSVPCIGLDSFQNLDDIQRYHLDAMQHQLVSLIPRLEDISGNKFDIGRLARTVELSRQCSELWEQVLITAAHRPSPLTFFDSVVLMGPAVVARGTKAPIEFYEKLLEELQHRIQHGIAAVADERHRVYWEGMPVWGSLRALTNLFLRRHATVVASTYCNSWILKDLSPEDPLGSMARAYLQLFIARSDRQKKLYLEEMSRTFDVDAFVFVDAKTCPYNTNSKYGMPGRLAKELDLPVITISADMNDPGLFSMEQSTTRIEALLEQLEYNRF